MRKIFKKISVVAIVCIAMLISACNVETVDSYNSKSSTKESTTVSKTEKDDKSNKDDNDKKDESKEQKTDSQDENTSDKKATDTNNTNSNGTASGGKSTEPKKTNSEGTAGNKNENKEPQTPVEKEEPKKPVVQEPKKSYVNLQIDCKVLVNNLDKIKEESKKALVPTNGLIYPSKRIEITEGETVFEFLKRETRANRIHLDFVYTPVYESAYIKGINNLYEFDAGDQSGWMYSVNGIFPNYGASKYKLKDGDTINWSYTTNLGKDLGSNFMG